MPFLSFTSKQPTAVTSVTAGRFLGADNDMFVVLNRLTLVSIYRLASDAEGQDRLDFIKDFPINGSLKYVRCVSLYHPTTHRLVRDLLFFCNIKQEVALVALSMNEECGLVLETLFLNTVGELCARQQHPGEVALCVSNSPTYSTTCLDSSVAAHQQQLEGDVSTSMPTRAVELNPFVAFGLTRGELFLFDVLTALGSHLLRCSSGRCREISDLISDAVVNLAKSRGKEPYLTPLVLDFTEFDVRDIVLVCEEQQQQQQQQGRTLLVLYADQHGKKHVSQYRLNVAVCTSTASSAVFQDEGSLTHLPVGPSATTATATAPAGLGGVAIEQRTILQSNVDPSASRLCRVEAGVFVVGSQLISLISCPHGTKGSTTTKELQNANYYVEATAVCVRDSHTIYVAYNNGELLQVTAAASPSSSSSERGYRDKKDSLCAAVHTARLPVAAARTVPDDMIAIGKSSVIVTSRFADTYLVDVASTREEVLLSNCGPVIDMCVLEDGPRTSVVASTGVAEHASLSLVRSAVSLNTDWVASLPRRVVNVLGVGSLLILQGSCFNTYLRFQKGRFSEFIPTWSPLDRFVPLRALYLEECEPEEAQDGEREGARGDKSDGSHHHHGNRRRPRQRQQRRVRHYYIVVHEHGYVVLRDCDGDDDGSGGSTPEGMLVLDTQVEVPGTVVHSAHIPSSSSDCGGDDTAPHRRRQKKTGECRKDGVSMALATEGFIYYYQKGVRKLTWELTCPVSCIASLSNDEIMYGEWNQHVVILNLRTQRIVSRIALPSIAHSLACVPVGAGAKDPTHERTIFAGLVDGSLVELSNAAAHELAYMCVKHSHALMHRPVELRVLGESNSLICLGENPLIIIPQPKASFDITGFSLASVHSCGTLWCGSGSNSSDNDNDDDDDGGGSNADDHHPYNRRDHQQQRRDSAGHRDAFVKKRAVTGKRQKRASRLNFFFSQKENRLYTGVHSDITKTSHIPTYVRHTVTLITYVPNWNGFVFVARQKQCDTLQFFPTASLESTSAGTSSFALDTRFSHFLDNERCVFIEPIVLGGPNTDDLRKSTVPASDEYVVLVGSSFTFPDEQTSRSGRLSWYRLCNSMAASRGGRTLECVGDTDIEGPLLSCCVVPSYKGRIALGVCGCVFLYNYNPIDRTFVPEEKCRIGVTLTKLLPIFAVGGGQVSGSGSTTTTTMLPNQSTIIAFDARCSAIVVRVDAVQGTLTVCGRDAKLRGIVDGVCMDDHMTLCCSDDSLNMYFMEYERPHRRNPALSPDSSDNNNNNNNNNTNDDTTAEGREEKGECRRLAVVDEYHLGDLITTMRTGSFAPISLSKGEQEGLLPNTFVRNIKGSQVVFGTAYGAFGSVTQVNMVAYLFLKALEEAIASSGHINGVYSHKGFRSLLCIGQELDTLSNPSLRKPRFQQPPLLHLGGLQRQAPNRFCDGDRVKDFLLLSEVQREKVLRTAEAILATRLYAYATGKCTMNTNTIATTTTTATASTSSFAPMTTDEVQTAEQASPLGVGATVASSLETKEAVKTCNKYLEECALPTIPFRVPEVVSCVTEMKKNF